MTRFLDDSERAVVEAVAALADGNPFLPERVANEGKALGAAFRGTAVAWHADAALDGVNPNVPLLVELVETLAPRLRDRLARGVRADARELEQYESLVQYLLFGRCVDHLYELIDAGATAAPATKQVYERFAADAKRFLVLPGVALAGVRDPAHLFALAFQVRRAFHYTFRQIYGGSAPAAYLRAAVWESIFTHDRRRYVRALHQRMGDITTLVVGESGTGKELVARAIAFSRYVSFDARRHAFADDWAGAFVAVNLSALAPALIESELFGHRRGAFTGALEDRSGYLETCAGGTVFLDEIGELGGDVQVKLLRVLQSRTFQRVGETRERPFRGKVIAATNRDLAGEIRAGRFRADLYYRLCADVITMPTLREQLADAPEDIRNLILVLAPRIAGHDEREALADQVYDWVTRHLGPGYPWPGNMRELEQCVRNVLIRGSYRPPADLRAEDPLFEPIRTGSLTADELLRRYCTHVHALTGSYQETARRLGIDRRTVRAKVDRRLLDRRHGQLRDDDPRGHG